MEEKKLYLLQASKNKSCISYMSYVNYISYVNYMRWDMYIIKAM